MNAEQMEKQKSSKGEPNWSLISVEKTERLSLWERFKKAFSTPDMNLEAWERMETKRSPSGLRSKEGRSF